MPSLPISLGLESLLVACAASGPEGGLEPGGEGGGLGSQPWECIEGGPGQAGAQTEQWSPLVPCQDAAKSHAIRSLNGVRQGQPGCLARPQHPCGGHALGGEFRVKGTEWLGQGHLGSSQEFHE